MPEFKLHEAFSEGDGAAAGAAAASGGGAGEADGALGAEEYKKKGNEAFQAKNWEEAIKNYNKAIQLDPKQAAFYSNRAACWSSKGNHESALADAKRCVELDPAFVKGYSRKGKALFDLGKLDEAEAAYQEGLVVDSTNAGCVSGLSDVKAARAQASRRASSGGAGGLGGMFGGLGGVGGLGKKFAESMKKGGIGGRMQMYAVVMFGYMMYNNYVKGGSKNSPSPSPDASDSYDDSGPAVEVGPMALTRSFAEVRGSWVSSLQAGSNKDQLLLWLHRSPLSAEAEFAPAIAQVLEKAKQSPPPRGLRVLAPDAPCHGYSPCAKGKAAETWLEPLVSKLPKSKPLTVVASGSAAIHQAVAVAREHTQPAKLLVVNPRAVAAARRPDAADAAGLLKWLGREAAAGSAAGVADAARWALATSAAQGSEEAEVDEERRLEGVVLPEGSQVVVMYSAGEKEDVDLHESFESAGFAPRIIRAKGAAGDDAALSRAVAAEAWRLHTGADESTDDI